MFGRIIDTYETIHKHNLLNAVHKTIQTKHKQKRETQTKTRNTQTKTRNTRQFTNRIRNRRFATRHQLVDLLAQHQLADLHLAVSNNSVPGTWRHFDVDVLVTSSLQSSKSRTQTFWTHPLGCPFNHFCFRHHFHKGAPCSPCRSSLGCHVHKGDIWKHFFWVWKSHLVPRINL